MSNPGEKWNHSGFEQILEEEKNTNLKVQNYLNIKSSHFLNFLKNPKNLSQK
jgi:hypothetical protein